MPGAHAQIAREVEVIERLEDAAMPHESTRPALGKTLGVPPLPGHDAGRGDPGRPVGYQHVRHPPVTHIRTAPDARQVLTAAATREADDGTGASRDFR